MKKILSLALSSLLFFSCENNRINGDGNLKSSSRKLSTFKSIIVDLPATITIDCNDTNNSICEINAEANTQNYIIAEVKENELVLTTKRNSNVIFNKPVTIKISTKNLEEIKVLGSCNVTIDGKPKSNTFVAALMGSGNITVNNANCNAIKAELSGSGNIYYEDCTTHQANYDLKGSGNIDAKTSNAKSVVAVLTGSGNINCIADSALDTRIVGSGNVYYTGNATITKHNNGSGEVIKH